MSNAAGALYNALRVMTDTLHIREYLEQTDPQALAQALDACRMAGDAKLQAIPNEDLCIPGGLFDEEPHDESDDYYAELP